MAPTDQLITKRITMPCDIESRRPPGRKAAWHRDCPWRQTCTCPAHEHDGEDQQ
jgi:hypothetical protein